jgi:DMSO/TMAO reductase YedYZ molybdopterin-dependent catalytic subunit
MVGGRSSATVNSTGNTAQWVIAKFLAKGYVSRSFPGIVGLPLDAQRAVHLFEGIPIAEVMKHVELLPEAQYVLVHADPNYTTNLPIEDLLADDAMFVLKYEGQPLTPEHGYPVRLLVPKLYLWKSAKWVRGLEFLTVDQPGFWEQYGYHNHGDPWQEERYGQVVYNTMQKVRAGR